MTSSGGEMSAQAAYDAFWPKATEEIRTMDQSSFKHQELPLARIKKIMKLDEDVKMISAEAPVLFAKASELFINELTMRAWIHTEDNKRRTLQRNDIAMAITKYDQFDFLIDIVPRDDIKPNSGKARDDPSQSVAASGGPQAATTTVRMIPEQVTYYMQQQQQMQPVQVQQPQAAGQQPQQQQQQQPQVIQLQPTQIPVTPQPGGIQIVQQIVGQNGEIQQIPIQLNQQQLNLIRAQMTSQQQQPLVIQTAPIQAQGMIQQQGQQQAQPQQQAPNQQQVYIQQE